MVDTSSIVIDCSLTVAQPGKGRMQSVRPCFDLARQFRKRFLRRGNGRDHAVANNQNLLTQERPHAATSVHVSR